jgi:gamma-glutamylaminecyclotransferase
LTTTSTRIFVYGTLKAGYPNFHINRGVRVPGRFETARRFSLYIVGEDHVPWLVDDGDGEHVEGELYDVSEDDLPQMDALEGIGQIGGYRREVIEVQRILADPSCSEVFSTHVYLQNMAHRDGRVVHQGPLKNYTQEHAALYRNL